MEDPSFWQDPEHAALISKRAAELKEEASSWESLLDNLQATDELVNEAVVANDTESLETLEKDVVDLINEFEKKEFALLFSGKHDDSPAVLAIHAGSGGREAQDWAEMLLRMYSRFADRRGFSVSLLNESRGEEGGIKSVMIRIVGRFAYGYLQSEAGVHRLVRISPFDAEKMRHTTFALVEVLPELEEASEVVLDGKDLRIDTYLASGHGGQSVNTTYSAVRIVHIPTGITVTCQNERSQLQNKETALKILRGKLVKIEEAKLADEKSALRGEYQSAEWGNQIRSYVLQPYQLVKDHRTDFETSDTKGVLDGDIDAFIEAYLRDRSGRENRFAKANEE